MNSRFRPRRRPDPAILDDHRPLLQSMERRGLIRGGLSLGALTMLTGCDVTLPASVEAALLSISRLNDGVQAWLFDPNKLAHTALCRLRWNVPRSGDKILERLKLRTF